MNPLEFNLKHFNPLKKKMIPENKFQSTSPENVPNCANLPPGKIEKIIIKESLGLSLCLSIQLMSPCHVKFFK